MSSDLMTAVVAGGISLVGTFGSIILKDRLDANRQSRPSPGVSPSALPQSREGGVSFLPFIVALAAAAIGYVSQIRLDSFPIDGVPDPYKPLSLLIPAIALVLLWWRARRRGAGGLAFQIDMIVLWAGWCAGAALRTARMGDDLVGITLVGWAICAVAGGLVLLGTRRLRG